MFLVFDYEEHIVKIEKEFSLRAKTITFQVRGKARIKQNLLDVMSKHPWHARLTYDDLYQDLNFKSRINFNVGQRSFPVEFNSILLCWSNRMLTQNELNVIANYLYGYCVEQDWQAVITNTSFFDYLQDTDPEFVKCRLLRSNDENYVAMITEPFELADDNSYVSIDDVMKMLSMLPPEIIDEIIEKYRHI